MDENWSLCIFEPPFCFWGSGAKCTVNLRLTGKLVVDFLFVLIELISLCVTAEALRANFDWKSAFFERVGQFLPNFHIVVDIPCEPFLNGEIG